MKPRSPYIVGPVYDWAFFLAPPMLALLIGILVADTPLTNERWELGPAEDSMIGFLLGTVIHAHLVAVVFRSHGNKSIRRMYPLRFFVVPVVLYLAILVSTWIAVAASVVATFWDVWHSGAQTFGFARIYERNHGTPPELGRRMDFWLNQLMYAGPILAGATLMDHVESFDSFADIGDAVFSSVPAHVEGVRGALAWVVLSAGVAFLIAYAMVYWRLAQRGYRPPWHKIWLVGSTGFVSVYTWGFNSWGEAFLIMNLFHGVQYLALVWAMEKKTIVERFRLVRRPRTALALYLAAVVAYGFAVQLVDSDLITLWGITIVVSLMHFWYDAFVWSVRKAQI